MKQFLDVIAIDPNCGTLLYPSSQITIKSNLTAASAFIDANLRMQFSDGPDSKNIYKFKE